MLRRHGRKALRPRGTGALQPSRAVIAWDLACYSLKAEGSSHRNGSFRRASHLLCASLTADGEIF